MSPPDIDTTPDIDTPPDIDSPPVETPVARWCFWIETALVFLVFFVHAAGAVPGANEPYYLAKAKHFWDPQWCGGDAFLESADAHLVFYWLFGWLTLFVSLTATAWIGRILTWALLAWAWCRLGRALVPRGWFAVLSAALFVCFNTRMHMAGEWVVGSFEAKGFAFVFIFLAIEAIVRDRWRLVWPLLGAASAFHVLLGGWSAVAAAFTWFLAGRHRPPLVSMLPAMALGGLLALPGLWPALQLGWGADETTVHAANRIQVFGRLGHHLNPREFLAAGSFPGHFGLRHLALLAFWAVLLNLRGGDARDKRLGGFVLGSVLIAVAGVVIAFAIMPQRDFNTVAMWQRNLAAGLLRFYWFRLSDVMLPAGAALAAAACVARSMRARPKLAQCWLATAMLIAVVHLGDMVATRHYHGCPPADRKFLSGKPRPGDSRDDIRLRERDRYEAWLDVCEKVAQQTPAGAVVLTPRISHTFKWHAGRAEVVTWKEMPQDGPSIKRWWERLRDVHRRGEPKKGWYPFPNDIAPEHLGNLGHKYDFDYVLGRVVPKARIDLKLVYGNNSFALYELKKVSQRDTGHKSGELPVSGGDGHD